MEGTGMRPVRFLLKNRRPLRVREEYPVNHPRISGGICGSGTAGQGDYGAVPSKESSGVLGGGVKHSGISIISLMGYSYGIDICDSDQIGVRKYGK